MRYKGIPIDEISLFSTPKIYSELLLKLSKDWLYSLFQLAIKRAPLIASIVALWLGLLYIPFLHVSHPQPRHPIVSLSSHSIGSLWG
jgi:hypothetical protein